MKTFFVLLVLCLFSFKGFSQEQVSDSLPPIKVSEYSLPPYRDKYMAGMVPFGNGIYTDSLVNHFDTVIQIKAGTEKKMPMYQAIWGKDTLTYKCLPSVWHHVKYDFDSKKKYRVVDVESQLPPYTRFTASIEGLTENEIAILTDSMQRMKSPQDTLQNAFQTCVFYALESVFRLHGICPDPIITRNTTYANTQELPAFFDHFLTRGAEYPCQYKKVKDVIFPNHSVLVIINGYGDIIHAFFYHNNLFYTKNGRFFLKIYHDIHPILKTYGEKDYSGKIKLSKAGKMLKGQSIRVYTFNPEVFSSLPQK